MMSSTETMLYCLSIYFGSVNIRKTRWSIPGSLIASIAGILASIFLAGLLLDT
jgi:spore maturation protein B